jgi:hypothetical protein
VEVVILEAGKIGILSIERGLLLTDIVFSSVEAEDSSSLSLRWASRTHSSTYLERNGLSRYLGTNLSTIYGSFFFKENQTILSQDLGYLDTWIPGHICF